MATTTEAIHKIEATTTANKINSSTEATLKIINKITNKETIHKEETITEITAITITEATLKEEINTATTPTAMALEATQIHVNKTTITANKINKNPKIKTEAIHKKDKTTTKTQIATIQEMQPPIHKTLKESKDKANPPADNKTEAIVNKETEATHQTEETEHYQWTKENFTQK